MRLLPARRFVVETPLAPEEALRRLADAVEAPRFRHGHLHPTLGRPFVGAVSGDAFDVERATRQRLGFAPVIVGRVAAADGGARVTGRMRLRYPGVAFLALWFGALLYGAATIGRRALAAGRFDPLVLAPLGMALGVAAIVGLGFASEARRALAALAKVTRATRAEMD